MDRIRTMVDATPATRNRAVDLYRVIALLFVVLGHWLASAVWIEVGFGWATEARRPRNWTLLVVLVAAPVLLLAATAYGPYPVSMVAVPGAPENNTLPPTAAMLVIGAFQCALMRLAEPAASRWVSHRGPWTAVVAISSVMMTVYLWHLTAVALVVLAGYGIGWGFDIEPATAAWFVTRPIWIAVLTAVLAILVVLFGWAEHAVRKTATPHPVLVAGGAIAIVVAIAFFVTEGVVTREGDVIWGVLMLYAAGTLALGAWPVRPRRSQPKGQDLAAMCRWGME